MDMTRTAINESRAGEAEERATLAGYKRLVARLPVTMRPSLTQQINAWESLFPYERNRLAAFLRGLDSFQQPALDSLVRPLLALEEKMGVARWTFSQTGDTMENASQLARSEHYAEWRREVQRIFEAIDSAGRDKAEPHALPMRLVLILLPKSLPVAPLAEWKPWDPRGQIFHIAGDAGSLSKLLVDGAPGMPGIGSLFNSASSGDSSALWLIDADVRQGEIAGQPAYPDACCLDYALLKGFRDEFLAQVNTVPKNIEATDQTLAAMRRQDWDKWLPAELKGQPRLRNFVIELFLSGNGALIFSNAFVEWAASEALRRARPRALVARFGLRSKPKPFTGIAIFENQQRISALPDVDDPEGSAIDALILARYIWLAAARYPEAGQTLCLCVSEYRNAACIIAPQGKGPAWTPDRPVTPEEVQAWIMGQLSS